MDLNFLAACLYLIQLSAQVEQWIVNVSPYWSNDRADFPLASISPRNITASGFSLEVTCQLFFMFSSDKVRWMERLFVSYTTCVSARSKTCVAFTV